MEKQERKINYSFCSNFNNGSIFFGLLDVHHYSNLLVLRTIYLKNLRTRDMALLVYYPEINLENLKRFKKNLWDEKEKGFIKKYRTPILGWSIKL